MSIYSVARRRAEQHHRVQAVPEHALVAHAPAYDERPVAVVLVLLIGEQRRDRSSCHQLLRLVAAPDS